jgi:hypothetical protein
MDTQVVLPAAISAVAVLAALTAVGFCLHRRTQNLFLLHNFHFRTIHFDNTG